MSEVKKGAATEVSFRLKNTEGCFHQSVWLELREETASTSYVWKDKVKSHTINFIT